jgi:ubiquinone/menaquinone biosynthesis C-methylase UbiE
MNMMNLDKKIEKIIHKIVKNKNIHSAIQKIIVNRSLPMDKKMFQISYLIHNDSRGAQSSVVIARTFTTQKLTQYIIKNHPQNNAELKIADIGGGNGQVLREIGKNLGLNRNHLYCVEQKTEWCDEPRANLNEPHLQFLYWDNDTIPVIADDSLDIVLIMVALHHMTDETIHSVLKNVERLTRKGAKVILKEHDCRTPEDKFVIDWEHHLYHLVNAPQIHTYNDILSYQTQYINHFKTEEWFDDAFAQYRLLPIVKLNRLFETTADTKNPTQLYWKIYEKN